MTHSGTLLDEEREPTQPIELEEVEPGEGEALAAQRPRSAPPPLPPQARAGRAGGSTPPALPGAGGERVRASGVHRIERPGSVPPRAGSLPPAPPPPAGSLPPPGPSSVGPGSFSAAPSAVGKPAPGAEGLREELRSVSAHRDRLRLRVAQQDDRIGTLERELRARDSQLQQLTEALRLARDSHPSPTSDLKRIQGIGPAFERLLKEHGVHSIEDVAGWGPERVVEIARLIGTTPHRIERDAWVQSARELVQASV